MDSEEVAGVGGVSVFGCHALNFDAETACLACRASALTDMKGPRSDVHLTFILVPRMTYHQGSRRCSRRPLIQDYTLYHYHLLVQVWTTGQMHKKLRTADCMCPSVIALWSPLHSDNVPVWTNLGWRFHHCIAVSTLAQGVLVRRYNCGTLD